MNYSAFDVVVVPFPFTDRRTQKRRPALILSKNEEFSEKCGHYVLAMITSQKNPAWPLDTPITDMNKSGLTESLTAFLASSRFFILNSDSSGIIINN